MRLSSLERLWTAMFPIRLDWIQIEVSAVCNASCGYCVQGCYRSRLAGGLMEADTFSRIEPNFPHAGLVFLQGWGEPLLHPGFWEMVRRVKAAGTPVGFTTNGTLLHEDNLSMLLETGVDVMGVSLAGTTAETNDSLRRGCSFAQIDTALRALKDMKQGLKGKAPSVHLAFMLLGSNLQELSGLPHLAAEWGVDQVVINTLSFIGSGALQEESPFQNPPLRRRMDEVLAKAKAKARAMGVGFQYHGPEDDEPRPMCLENVLNSCFISWRGDVSPCVLANIPIGEGEAAEHFFRGRAWMVERFLFGNIQAQPLAEVWNSEKAHWFRRSFEERLDIPRPGMRGLPAPCRHCYKLFETSGGS